MGGGSWVSFEGYETVEIQSTNTMKTLKQLADIGAAAAFADNKRYHYMSVSEQSHSWEADEPARQAFAQAVVNAVMEDLVTNQISPPTKPCAKLQHA